jgi:putative transposase
MPFPKTHFDPRRRLPHGVPPWVTVGSIFFITISCRRRGGDALTTPAVAEGLLASAAYYHAQGRWFVRLFLLMPDHLHALLAFPGNEEMGKVLKDWKRYTARAHGMEWQRDWFDHRPRNQEEIGLKAAYIRQNPVRKGLVAAPEEWPWILES